MNYDAVLEDVRRYRAIASLYRQTASFRPLQKVSLLGQADEWEHRAVEALEDYLADRDLNGEKESSGFYSWARSELIAAA